LDCQPVAGEKDFPGGRENGRRFLWNANVAPSVCAKRYFGQNYANLMCVLFGKSTACCASVCVGGFRVVSGGFLGGLWVFQRWLHHMPGPGQTTSPDSRQSAWQTEPLKTQSAHTWPKTNETCSKETKHLFS